jgi:DHA1 family inner membrane transport protein
VTERGADPQTVDTASAPPAARPSGADREPTQHLLLSPARRWLALIALALGGFGIGVTEFVSMGLLPNIAQDLLPGLYAAEPADGNAMAGHLISAYALGVVVGAPTIATAAARWPRKRLLTVLVACFVAGNLATALLPSFGWILAARFLSGLPHGAYFGIASLVAAGLMGPGKRARGIAIVMSGLTVANVVGVPIGTYLGQNFGWRSAFWLVTAIFAATLIAIVATVPFQAGNPQSTMRNELRAFTRLQIWLTLAMGSIGFGGMFAVYSYVAPVVTDVTGLDESVVPLVLVTFGVGMTIGNVIGGWAADKSVTRALLVFMPAIGLACLAFGLTAASPPGLFISIFLIGAAVSGASPTIQARLMDVAHDSQSIAAALNHSALNIGNSLGAFLGGAVIAAGFGYIAPAWVGIALSIMGVAVLLLSLSIDRRRGRAAH